METRIFSSVIHSESIAAKKYSAITYCYAKWIQSNPCIVSWVVTNSSQDNQFWGRTICQVVIFCSSVFSFYVSHSSVAIHLPVSLLIKISKL